MNEKLDVLSEVQLKAINIKEGPAMIIAGPGSGKTKVIASRIATLINKHDVDPSNILAMTFTNKAADEMRERCESLTKCENINIFTFHSLSAFLLRRYGLKIGIDQNFTIFDDGDQLRVIKKVFKDANKDPKKLPFKASTLLNEISNFKNKNIRYHEVINLEENDHSELISDFYKRYEVELKNSNALDFDDLLVRTSDLLNNSSEIRDMLEERYKYLLVDEFQDTNKIQMDISIKLSEKNKNIFVVGDPDQSIYSWRNAEPRNLLDFQKFFPGVEIIKLDQNYRSTKSIISVADELISHNDERFERELWTENIQGNQAVLVTAKNPKLEAEFVTREINYLIGNGYSPEQIAVMYRVNSQSRSMEDLLKEWNISYRLIGAVSFRERREIKDLLSYFSILINPNDEISLSRIINTPRRAISDKTFDLIRSAYGKQDKYSGLLNFILSKPWNENIKLTPRAVKGLEEFTNIISDLIGKIKKLNPEIMIQEILDKSKYLKYLEDDPDFDNRLRNIEELRIKAREIGFEIEDPYFKNMEFVQRFSLINNDESINNSDSGADSEKVTLITLHQAKGLEYSVVFIIGFEQGLLPHARSLENLSEMEEERRICYVGITRAKERLYLSNCSQRFTWNNSGKNMFSQTQLPSQFLSEIPGNLFKTAEYSNSGEIIFVDRKFDKKILNKNKGKKILNNNFNISDVVVHKVFGEGVILNISKENEEELLIKFEDYDKPKLILSAFGSLSKQIETNDQEFDYLNGLNDSNSDDDFSEYFDD
ncbi:MAG: UvrD-helicase domain-containing protein [Chloroflexota bacterium]|nr:UvrD-helicase domain-containing protein [Chloroflexota bacterium]